MQFYKCWKRGLSKERLLSNSTPRFLTDDEESTEKPLSVRQCSRLLPVGVLGLITNTSVFSEFSSKKITHHPLFYINYAFHKFLNLVCFTGPGRNIELSIISITVKTNPVNSFAQLTINSFAQLIRLNGDGWHTQVHASSYNKTLPLSDSSISVFKSYLKIYLFTLAYNVS